LPNRVIKIVTVFLNIFYPPIYIHRKTSVFRRSGTFFRTLYSFPWIILLLYRYGFFKVLFFHFPVSVVFTVHRTIAVHLFACVHCSIFHGLQCDLNNQNSSLIWNTLLSEPIVAVNKFFKGHNFWVGEFIIVFLNFII